MIWGCGGGGGAGGGGAGAGVYDAAWGVAGSGGVAEPAVGEGTAIVGAAPPVPARSSSAKSTPHDSQNFALRSRGAPHWGPNAGTFARKRRRDAMPAESHSVRTATRHPPCGRAL